jgi:hypothetical protein
MKMIEKVAMAIRDNPPIRREKLNDCGVSLGYVLDYTPTTKAAIAAMREPTDGMQQAHDEVFSQWLNEDVEGDESHMWRVMIDAALEGK